MISLLVSSKSMQERYMPQSLDLTCPKFLNEAQQLSKELSKLSVLKLQKIMHLSKNLAEETHKNILNWNTEHTHPAWFLFSGDVYKGLKINEFTKGDLEFAQNHMATLSGLYGIVRPLDKIHPYRLELGYKLKGGGYKNLYEYWGDKIAMSLPKNEVIINLASEEYIKVIRPYVKESSIITPWFMQTKNGELDFQAIHAKLARGAMARWIAKNRIDHPSKLINFNLNGYRFISETSTKQKPVFVRKEGYDFRADY